MHWNNTVSSALCARAAVVLFGLLAFASTHAHATPLGLHSTHPGDVTTHFTDVQYALNANPATGTLTA
ncbi:MAG TPA: hypothetical protein VGZ26_00645, partial [Pirellulales bacterium]|nr:hypothetical protein [Pirellulales bacterium]